MLVKDLANYFSCIPRTVSYTHLVKVNTVPRGMLSETVISPPWALIIDLHKDKPRPKLRLLSAILFEMCIRDRYKNGRFPLYFL